MKTPLPAIVVGLLLAVGISGTLSYVLPSSDSEHTPMVRRSLCNTFGGCGAKRSMPTLVFNGQRYGADDDHSSAGGGGGGGGGSGGAASSVNKRDPTVELVAEILDDLVDYLKTSDRYKHGNYIVMVPKPSSGAGGSGGGGPMQLTGNVQELQSGQIYASKDE